VTTRSLEIFFDAASQYYITGRYAVLAGLSPVAGNLLHHAIEMYLKGALTKTMLLRELKGRRHHLPKIWADFKEQAPNAGLDSFDALVSSLHAFEELRYPDSTILAKGMAVTIGVTRLPGTVAAPPALVARPEPTYELYLEEIDAFVNRIFEVASVNPMFFFGGLRTNAREYLKDGNAQRWAG
jgi:hypothetical protein